jgi:SAM-dependent methyltransferase
MKAAASRIVRANAWSEFWADAVQSHCVAGAPDIWRSLAAHWGPFAAGLPVGARVLDLGCGAGVVGSWMLKARPDLRISGIDSARIHRKLHPQLELLAETTMEELPFADQRFDAVVSQFGFEYSQRGAAAREIARVLKPGGALSLLVHHSASAVLVANQTRVAVLDGLLSASLRSAFCDGNAGAFCGLLSDLRERCGDDQLLGELTRSLPPRLGLPPENRRVIWAAIEQALAPEHCVAHAMA